MGHDDSPSRPLHDARAIGGEPGVRAGIADLDRLDHGAFICDRGGQILAANTAAQGLLEGRIDGDRRIRFARSGDDTAFAVLLKTALDTSRAGEAPVMACQLAFSALVVLRAIRLRRDVGPASDVLVLIEKQRASPIDALRRDYGLTATEARVAIALAEGNGVDEICARHGVGPATVRSHLKSIFRKTDTRGQVQLVVLVSGLWRSS